jgi:hypothetical protein
MYLIDRAALAHLGKIYALDGESGSEGLAAQMRLTSPWPVSTLCGDLVFN